MKKLNVLVMDVSAASGEIIRDIMERSGCIVTLAETWKEGFEHLANKHFTLICIDLHLADTDGINFCSQVRGIDEYQYTSLILLTSEDNATILKQAMLAGATDIFDKSDLDQLEVYAQLLVNRELKSLSARVLFVEDCLVSQDLMIDLLTNIGLDVDVFTRVEDAWDAYQFGAYELVITDVILEGTMSGVTLVRKIRQMEGADGDVPIIVTSGFNNVSRRIELFQLGINDYITKPIIQEELTERVYNQIKSYHLMLELRSQKKALYGLAMMDERTQLFNRYSLKELSIRYLSDVERNSNPLSLAILDIDYFKQINAEQGYDKGNQILSELGRWFKRTVRDVDMIARWSGGEFVFLLENCSEKAAVVLMTRLSTQLKLLNPAGISITVSVGVTTMSVGEKHYLGSLYELADKALYKAKSSGRDKVLAYEEDTSL